VLAQPHHCLRTVIRGIPEPYRNGWCGSAGALRVSFFGQIHRSHGASRHIGTVGDISCECGILSATTFEALPRGCPQRHQMLTSLRKPSSFPLLALHGTITTHADGGQVNNRDDVGIGALSRYAQSPVEVSDYSWMTPKVSRCEFILVTSVSRDFPCLFRLYSDRQCFHQQVWKDLHRHGGSHITKTTMVTDFTITTTLDVYSHPGAADWTHFQLCSSANSGGNCHTTRATPCNLFGYHHPPNDPDGADGEY
jgi:hypothetical protein